MNRVSLETQKPAQLETVRELRNLLEKVTQASVPHQSMRGRILLCLSEAVTNLVLHSEPGLNQIVLCFGHDNHGWWLEIQDDGAPWDPTKQNNTDVLRNFETMSSVV